MKRPLIQPHGGKLVDRTGASATSSEPPVSVTLSPWEQCDFEMIAVGAMSPLEGFMGEDDYNSVCDNLALAGNVTVRADLARVAQVAGAFVGFGDGRAAVRIAEALAARFCSR